MVNKENVRKWVAALRSGDYAQTTGVLQGHYGRTAHALIDAGHCHARSE